MERYMIDGSSLPDEERIELFQQVDKLSYMALDGPPDIRKVTFSFLYNGDIEEMRAALNITCPITKL